jgi:hypothetical protein
MPTRSITRPIWVGLLSVLALWLLVTGCAGSQEGAPPVVGEFVGKASAQDAYVALSSVEGSSANEAEVTAYVCNGPGGLAEWFTGTATDDSLDLVSNSGNAHLRATLEEDGATGTVDLPDGETVSVETYSSAMGPAGLSELTLDADGNLYGDSRGGKHLDLEGTERDGLLGYVGTVTLPDGETIPYEVFEDEGESGRRVTTAGVFRDIFLEDGTFRGSRFRSGGSTSRPWADPEIDP